MNINAAEKLLYKYKEITLKQLEETIWKVKRN